MAGRQPGHRDRDCAQQGATQHFAEPMLMWAGLVDEGDAQRTEGCNEACPIPSKDSSQNGDGQQNARSPTHTAIQVVAK